MDTSKYGSICNLISTSWHNAVSSFWMKYPNQYSKHVLTEDVLERSITPDGKLYTRRILSKTNPLPHWGRWVFSANLKQMVPILEESIVDPVTKTMKVYTWNISYKQMMDVQECMTIREPEMSSTMITREGWIDSSYKGFRRVLRQFGLTRWKSNAKKAHLGYVSMLQLHSTSNNSNAYNKEHTMESIKQAKDKAKDKAKQQAINLASMAQKFVTEKS
uniref:PRELI domain-containing protein 1, mitochondrial-like n=1 Tax=Phallusia mammillata TaxID=59560 RepID=A0A6F9DQG8_9ASCI|nr:PRELI domain-containing protein 1, mitochondrial-like [Phallusia mammillata]